MLALVYFEASKLTISESYDPVDPSSNYGEVLAAVRALTRALEMGEKEILIWTDSEYLIDHHSKSPEELQWRGCNSHMIGQLSKLQSLNQLRKVDFRFVHSHVKAGQEPPHTGRVRGQREGGSSGQRS